MWMKELIRFRLRTDVHADSAKGQDYHLPSRELLARGCGENVTVVEERN